MATLQHVSGRKSEQQKGGREKDERKETEQQGVKGDMKE